MEEAVCQMGENMSAIVRVDLLENSAVREAFITFFNARVTTDYNSIIIVHSTKLLVSDWTRGVQLIVNCTLLKYLLCFFQNAVFYSLFSCQTLSFLS